MKIVIDVGCARYGGDYSIERLVKEFSPDVVYGFDPSPNAGDEYFLNVGGGLGLGDVLTADIKFTGDGEYTGDEYTKLSVWRKAAWTYDGEIGFREDNLNSWVTYANDAPKVPCFDLATFISDLYVTKHDRLANGFLDPNEPEIILKLDCEGSEYDLLRHLINTGVDKLLKLAWVEWHDPDRGRALIESELACELHEWNW